LRGKLKDIQSLSLDEIAREWWLLHGDSGSLNEALPQETDLDRVNEIERRVRMMAQDLGVLPMLVSALARNSTSLSELAFIGTWVLEDAEQALGRNLTPYVKSIDLDPHTLEMILSGYRSRWLEADGSSF
jgi:exo-beta-1,3-glucanase (GH17 family)